MSLAPQNQSYTASSPPISVPAVEINSVMKMVYMWMTLGMLTTAVTAWFTATNPALADLRSSGVVMIGSFVLLFGSVIGISAGVASKRLSPNVAAALFFVFAGINGFSLSFLLQYFVQNEPGALTAAFGTTTILFGTMTFVGFTTKMDLSKYGTYLMIGLVGIIFASIFNWFIGSSALAFMISVGGVILFTALTAYDTQKIHQMTMVTEIQNDSNLAMKFSILGALTLYLDFINLFLFLLQLFAGGGRD